MEAPTDISAQTDTVVRPVRDVDAEALGRVHATCWHETYDHLISKAALENVSPKRLAELWTHWAHQGPEFKMFAALVGGEIVGFVGSRPGARPRCPPHARALLHLPARPVPRHRHRAAAVRCRRRARRGALPLGRRGQPARAPVLRAQWFRPRRRQPHRAVLGRDAHRGPLRSLTAVTVAAPVPRGSPTPQILTNSASTSPIGCGVRRILRRCSAERRPLSGRRSRVSAR